jgi:hypothetical protein
LKIAVSRFYFVKMAEYLSSLTNKTLDSNRRIRRLPSLAKKLKIPLLIIAALAILVGIGVWAQQGVGQKPLAKVGQDFSVQARTNEKVRVRDADLGVKLTNAEIANSLLVQGKKAKTREGKTFLILNMEVENTFSVPLYIFPIDLLRLVREDGKRIAPSVHQGTVEVRPISTKKSNVGFVIDPGDKNFKIEFGELSGDKQTLEISFR